MGTGPSRRHGAGGVRVTGSQYQVLLGARREAWLFPGVRPGCSPASPASGLYVAHPSPAQAGSLLPAPHRPLPAAGDQPLCSIPIENILAVEGLEEESFKMKNVSVSGASPSSALGPPAAPRHPGSSAEPVTWVLASRLEAENLPEGAFWQLQGPGAQLWGPCGVSLKLDFGLVVNVQGSCKHRTGPPCSLAQSCGLSACVPFAERVPSFDLFVSLHARAFLNHINT